MQDEQLGSKKIEELIELYHIEECLWNSADKTYMDADLKKASLERISAKLGGVSIG